MDELKKHLIVRVKTEMAGGHTRVSFWMQMADVDRTPSEVTCGKVGELCMRNEEAEVFLGAMMAMHQNEQICLSIKRWSPNDEPKSNEPYEDVISTEI